MPRAVARFLSCVGIVAISLSFPTAVAAQDSVPADDPVESVEQNESQATIEWVTRSLVAIAGGTAVLLVVYIWHTNPRRRLAVATRRRVGREESRRLGMEDEFVLPVDVDAAPDGDHRPGSSASED